MVRHRNSSCGVVGRTRAPALVLGVWSALLSSWVHAAGPDNVAAAQPVSNAAAPNAPAAPKAKWTDKVKLSGFGVLWFTPTSDLNAPDQPKNSLSIRFARVAVDAAVSKGFSFRLHAGFEFAMPFLDLKLTWKTLPYLNVTAGQFKIPAGASALTPAPKLALWDRPLYLRQLVKATFRDVGLMVHTQKGGIFGGVLEYALGAYEGGGRTRVGPSRGVNEPGEYLYAGRVVVNPGAVWLGPTTKNQLALGLSYATSKDPAVATGEPAADRAIASNLLGRHNALIAVPRRTHLAGADLTLSAYKIWLQAESLYLHSVATQGNEKRRAVGASLEAGYTFKTKTQPVARCERFDKNLDQSNNEVWIAGLGVNQPIGKHVLLSAFASMSVYHDAGASGRNYAPGGMSRAMIQF